MAEVKFGSKEWSEELNSVIQFPEKFTFYYNKGDNTIQVVLFEAKGRLENTRRSMTKPPAFRPHPKDLTVVVAARETQDSQEYYEVVKNLKGIQCK